MKILSFSYSFDKGIQTGREMLAETNSLLLQDLFGDNLTIVNAKPQNEYISLNRLYALFGWLNGLNQILVEDCIEIIKKKKLVLSILMDQTMDV